MRRGTRCWAAVLCRSTDFCTIEIGGGSVSEKKDSISNYTGGRKKSRLWICDAIVTFLISGSAFPSSEQIFEKGGGCKLISVSHILS